jgi:hypothetical protein
MGTRNDSRRLQAHNLLSLAAMHDEIVDGWIQLVTTGDGK